jgi:hypothetical protein
MPCPIFIGFLKQGGASLSKGTNKTEPPPPPRAAAWAIAALGGGVGALVGSNTTPWAAQLGDAIGGLSGYTVGYVLGLLLSIAFAALLAGYSFRKL